MNLWGRAKHGVSWRLKRVRRLFATAGRRGDSPATVERRERPGQRSFEEGLIQSSFPIDIVYTWVDMEDPEFREVLNAHLPPGAETNRTTMSAARFACHEELRYSLRSIEMYAPWYSHIYLVTNGQVPHWLAKHPRLTVVTHDEILAPEYLPTFNSHVIGSALHRIPGLSEHYIYFNDDVMLLRPIPRTAAFTDAGLAHGFISMNRIGNGPPVPHETATEWAAKNARDLLLREHGFWFDRRLTHMFHPQRRSVAEECERLFADEYDRFRRNRFRQVDDVLCCSFLHPYVGYITGRVMLSHDRGVYVRVREASARNAYQRLIDTRANTKGRAVVCLNDYIPPEDEAPDYAEALTAFLEQYYPRASSFERPSEAETAAPEGEVAPPLMRAAE